MHEERVMRDLVDRVESVARDRGGGRVTAVRLWVGALSHFTEGGLRDRWSVATRGTVAEGAPLELELSNDPNDPRAAGVVLRSLDLSSGPEDR